MMKTFAKTASTIFLSVAMLSACGDGEEDTIGNEVPDTDNDTNEVGDGTDEEDDDEEENEEVSSDTNMSEDDSSKNEEAHQDNDQANNNEDYTESNDTSEEGDNMEEEVIDTPETGYDPEEVTGTEEPDQDGNVVYPGVLENLEMPYIYENTVVYNGTINPEQNIRFELPNQHQDDTRSVDPYVSEEGDFSISLGVLKLEAGDELIVYVMGGMPHEQQFRLPIQPEEEGKEVVESSADTSDLEASIQEETSVYEMNPDQFDPDENMYQYHVETVGDAESVYLGYEGDSQLEQLKHISGSTYQIYFAEEPDQTVYFYIVASGVTTTIEEQIPEENESTDSE
ncbi:hypothetical protein HNR44_002211 [Geomicrobium halophilum]|uniref:Uncharacterized protein n=1 Tax=Geomicrobium halophilum TaxID=549000 RepID=A0A841Q236_9BACL|nr:hypothetical protein [Geomicrobium halophilum]MBB6450228.1 hypothetical protein [Geomicrobium halophilum]